MDQPVTADARSNPDQVLGLAIERAYRAFAHNQVGSSMVVLRRDVTPDDVTALSGQVRSVPAAAIDRWLPHAVTTWGTEQELRALLPRVLELLTAGLLDTAPEVLFAKLRQAEVDRWPPAERAALDEVVAALWLASLARHPSTTGVPVSRVLACFVELGRPIGPYLEDWMLLLAANGPEHRPAGRHLADLVRQVDTLHHNGLEVGDLFWSPHPAEAATLSDWLASPLTRAALRG